MFQYCPQRRQLSMSTITQPPPVHFDAVRRFTVEEYYRLVEAGILEEDARVELLDGQIIPMAPIGPEHHWILDELNAAFVEQRAGRFNVGPGRSFPVDPAPRRARTGPGAVAARHRPLAAPH